GYTAPHFPLYLVPALAVEAVALVIGTERLGRFALGTALSILTAGFAGEWAWSHVWAPHPWPASLLPEVLWVGALAAFGGALLGVALGAITSGRAMSAAEPLVSRRAATFALVGATCALAVALAIPVERVPSTVTGTLT